MDCVKAGMGIAFQVVWRSGKVGRLQPVDYTFVDDDNLYFLRDYQISGEHQ